MSSRQGDQQKSKNTHIAQAKIVCLKVAGEMEKNIVTRDKRKKRCTMSKIKRTSQREEYETFI